MARKATVVLRLNRIENVEFEGAVELTFKVAAKVVIRVERRRRVKDVIVGCRFRMLKDAS